MDVVALGELLIDFTTTGTDASGYPTMAAHPGGAPANFLAALASFGFQTALLGKVGTDMFGRLLTDTLERAKICSAGIVRDENVFTTLAFVAHDENGERSFSFARKPGADTQLRYEELALDLIDEARVFHFGTLSLTDEPAQSCTRKAVAYAKERGKQISFDPNLRLPLWRNRQEARQQMLWGLHQADIVKISQEEVAFLWSVAPEQGAEIILDTCGAQLVFVTCGKEGCFFANRNSAGMVKSPAVRTVDTTGAGDIFGGSAMAQILRKGKPLTELGWEELHEITTFACTAASLSTEKYGGIESVPSEAAVLSVIGGQP